MVVFFFLFFFLFSVILSKEVKKQSCIKIQSLCKDELYLGNIEMTIIRPMGKMQENKRLEGTNLDPPCYKSIS